MEYWRDISTPRKWATTVEIPFALRPVGGLLYAADDAHTFAVGVSYGPDLSSLPQDTLNVTTFIFASDLTGAKRVFEGAVEDDRNVTLDEYPLSFGRAK